MLDDGCLQILEMAVRGEMISSPTSTENMANKRRAEVRKRLVYYLLLIIRRRVIECKQ